MEARSKVACILAFAVVLTASAARAQVRTTGKFVGTVKDASGAIVADADVDVTDLGTGIVAKTKSSKEGGCVVPALHPGHHRLLAGAVGFELDGVSDLAVETGSSSI